ncbi:DUF1800 domain-containing protein [Ideonella sp. BN130291]|uniref:DUF1800 domain-containing protein n=1 Tax=Ideonella sp. BN130291 TaxID=3112940 RepID=UPI002E25F8CF|nr:DUF1800 domain-containing protein [Ideonella sp. BN130291]
MNNRRGWRVGLAAGWLVLLAACGGGNGGDTATSTDGTASPQGVADKPASREEAARFLNQATFGATEADIDHVLSIGYRAWIDEQFSKPATQHRAYWDGENAAIKAVNPNSSAGQREVLDSFYRQAVQGEDQLRGRVAYALSQIFVISMLDNGVGENPRGAAGYMDMLGANAFGRYRDLLEGVARHPMMGVYLSHLKNQKEDPAKGRVPDENFAREVMQLFSIGLKELNSDGSQKMVNGAAVDTYTHDDIAGLAKVFTGWSWDGPDTADGRFWGWSGYQDAERLWMPMQGYTQFHSLGEKRFLGQTVVAQGKADPNASLKVALDTLASHPNVGPFIGRQLIQRMVTGHPSPAYVKRVAEAFDAKGSGQRGDMKALIKAVLLDPEARTVGNAASGKLREPVLRLTAVLRAFGATSDTGHFLIGTTDDPGTQLGQTPMRSPSVFNFYRPGYVPPGTEAGALGLTEPEMQITHETTVAGYANYMRSGMQNGFGQNGVDWKAPRRDVQLSLAAEIALADKPAELVDRITGRLMGAQADAALKADMVAAVESVALPALKPDGSNQTSVDNAKKNRVWLALTLAAVAPEFIVMK